MKWRECGGESGKIIITIIRKRKRRKRETKFFWGEGNKGRCLRRKLKVGKRERVK